MRAAFRGWGVALGIAAPTLGLASGALAWDVRCVDPSDPNGDAVCPDPFARAQTPWIGHPLAEHRRLLELSLEMAGLPAELRDPFDLTVYTGSETLLAEGGRYDTIRPVPIDAERVRVRQSLTIQMMANLPDFSYTLWDWASGNELCPPDPDNPSALDCHNYETHIGWLNSNHMLPQARHWYGYLHALAIARAQACAALAARFDEPHRTRFLPWLVACEKEALAIEGVAQHYLQDAWAAGHMLERWGSTEVADFGGDRALGFAVSGFVGALHGSKALLDDDSFTGLFAPWDDPINAPHEDVGYRDGLDGPTAPPRPGVGDRFLPQLLGEVPGLDDYGAQREALFGCAVDGLRAVYAATAQLHGALADPGPGFDARRSVATDSCWVQRVTNLAYDSGLGVHRGAFDGTGIPRFRALGGPFAWTLGNVLGDWLIGAPQLSDAVKRAFQRDIGYVATLALIRKLSNPDDAELASGQVPSLAGIGPNSTYARGGPGVPPASYSDPLLPWSLTDPDPLIQQRKQALHLTFADAHAADRCNDLTVDQLEAYVASVAAARDAGDPEVLAARCGQCAQMVAPHLRFGIEGDHDAAREAFCALAAEPPVAPAFVYSGDDPATFPGLPSDLDDLRDAAEDRCGCRAGIALSRAFVDLFAEAFASSDAGGADDDRRQDQLTVQRDAPAVVAPLEYAQAYALDASSSSADASAAATTDAAWSVSLSQDPATGSVTVTGSGSVGLSGSQQSDVLCIAGASSRGRGVVRLSFEVTADTASYDASWSVTIPSPGPTVLRRTTITLSDAATGEPVFFAGTGESISTSGALPPGRYDFAADLQLEDGASCGSVSEPIFSDAYSAQGTVSLSFSATPGP